MEIMVLRFGCCWELGVIVGVGLVVHETEWISILILAEFKLR